MSSAVFLTPAPRTDPAETQRAIDKMLAAQPKAEAREPNWPVLQEQLTSLRYQLRTRQDAIKAVTTSVRQLKAEHKELTENRAALAARRQTSDVVNTIYGYDQQLHRLVHQDNRGRKAGLLSDEQERLDISIRCAAQLEKNIQNLLAEYPGLSELPGAGAIGSKGSGLVPEAFATGPNRD